MLFRSRSAKYSAKIVLRHVVAPVSAYSLEVYRTSNDRSEDDAAAHILLSSAEAYGLSVALENSIGFICFGVPRSLGHAHAAGRRSDDASAA